MGIVISALQEFEAARSIIACRISSSDLKGLVTKHFIVPSGAKALVFFSNGDTSIFNEGQEIAGKFELVLAKISEIMLELPLTGLRTQDEFLIDAKISISFLIDTSTVESFHNFSSFMGYKVYKIKDLEYYVTQALKTVLFEFASKQDAKDLHKKNKTSELTKLVIPRLDTHLMGTGIDFERLVACDFYSREYEQQISKLLEVKRTEEIKQSRVREIAQFLQNEESVQKLVEKLPRELQAVIYSKFLLDRGITERDVELSLSETACDVIYRTMQEVLAQEKLMIDDIHSEYADKIVVAIGHKIIMLDKRNSYALSHVEINEPIRSVRFADINGTDFVLIGTKKACILYNLSTRERLIFQLPDTVTPRGGINSIAVYSNTLYATHSEYGVAIWDINNPGSTAEIVFDKLTSTNKTTRAIQAQGDNLIFATGEKVYIVNLKDMQQEPVGYESFSGAITSIVAGLGIIYASSEDGNIVSWRVGEPAHPQEVLKKNAQIYRLRVTKLRGIAHLLYSFNDTSIHARVIGQTLETEYEAQGPLFSNFDAASDLICAANYRGRSLYMWDPAYPKRPSKVIDLSAYEEREIIDLYMSKQKALV